ncbi:MAG: HEAT repeat domain-containing protein [Verrucomicrobiales bacterium]
MVSIKESNQTNDMMIRLLAILFFSISLVSAKPLQLKDGDVIAFLGGSDLVRAQKDGTLEAAITHRFKDLNIKFRDLAWEGDTVFFQSTVRERWRREAFGSLNEQLKRVGANVVISQFGKMESLNGEAALKEFLESYEKLINELQSENCRVVILAPSSFEWDAANDQFLDKYTEGIESLAIKKKIPFVKENFAEELGEEPPMNLILSVREKHRLWYDYWRPANWKCLFGDDSKRVFSNAAEGLPSFKEEWQSFPKLIENAEVNIRKGLKNVPGSPPKRTGSREADIKKELEAFDVMDGFEVNLFADETQGIANPLSVRWDARGRMFVACSDVYPQIEPGVMPNDKVMMIEDLDGDGVGEKSSVFARGLSIPTGMEVGADGVYVGQNTELLLFDWEGKRKLVLSGFGNGDSHQTMNSFAWSPGGELWFCQGDGIESRVETPYGVSSLFQAGVYRLRPDELKLDPLLDDFMGPGNPWGVAFDDYGQSFVIDGAGGVSYLTPASIPAKRRLRLPRIGRPGGYCGIDCLGASNLPAEMAGDFLIGDYKKNQVSRFAVSPDGGGFKVNWREPILRSRHRNFRPIDVKIGPDGAIYVVDWYNPLTCHQDDFYRHPVRDKTHGRIWRITPKKGALKVPELVSLANKDLVDKLASPERWTRLKAKQVLSRRDQSKVINLLRNWVASREGLDLLEALSLLEFLGAPDSQIVIKNINSDDPRIRAYAARVIGRWGTRLEGYQDLLLSLAQDKHPRVRMEALLSCAQIPEPNSILVAAAVAEVPKDKWINYAFSQAVHHLKPIWIPAFREGNLDIAKYQSGFSDVLSQSDSKAIIADIRDLVQKENANNKTTANLLSSLVILGDEDDLKFVLNLKELSPSVLIALKNQQRPEFEIHQRLANFLKTEDQEIRKGIIDLIGAWEVEELIKEISDIASNARINKNLRAKAFKAMGVIGGKDVLLISKQIAANDNDPCQLDAIGSVISMHVPNGVKLAVDLLKKELVFEQISKLFDAVASRNGAMELLAEELPGSSINKEKGSLIRQAWIAKGLVSPELSSSLDQLAGIPAPRIEFTDSNIREFVRAGNAGDAKKGADLFKSAGLGCVACHKVGNIGGIIGPDLSALGSGVPFDRIVTEVMWPTLQVKEGYSLTRVVTKKSQTLQGYEQASREEDKILLRDFAGAGMHRISRDAIEKVEKIGSLMPPTAQILSKNDIADLLAYLFSLRG